MKSIAVTICLLPFLPVAMIVVALLSIAPRDSQPRKIRSWILDELDRLTNDYGAELIYLELPHHEPDSARIDNRDSPPSINRKHSSLVLVKGSRR